MEVLRQVKAGDTVILIGHEGHDEVLGTMGQAPGRVELVQSVEDVERMRVENPSRLAYVTQTTLSVDETLGIIEALRKRFPLIQGPKKNDICYATQNRQEAVKDLLGVEHIELLLVVGSSNSSNSRRLVEVARSAQVAGHLIDDASEIQSSWLTGIKRVGVTAGASAPENLVEEVLQRLRSLGGTVHEKEVIAETVTFPIPPELVRPSVEGSR
jgi:4-hydroxy-3-methylbut-2-enyl diphosphate reductase